MYENIYSLLILYPKKLFLSRGFLINYKLNTNICCKTYYFNLFFGYFAHTGKISRQNLVKNITAPPPLSDRAEKYAYENYATTEISKISTMPLRS